MIKTFEQSCCSNNYHNKLSELDSLIYCKELSYLYKKDKEGKPVYTFRIKKGEYLKTSYFVGVDWVDKNHKDKAIYVQPKQNDTCKEIDVMKMLFEALQEHENYKHLSDLCKIDFVDQPIIIEQKQDLLSPFLIAQFLQILKEIVRKGLKKTYYPVVNNLEAKVKGKILVNLTIKKNIYKNHITRNICKYDEFGYNGLENRILKKALLFSTKALSVFQMRDKFQELISYISPAFEIVSDEINVYNIKSFIPNPLYKEYERAIKLAKLILKRYSYNINQTNSQKIATPPFWIDMSKLFELYVYKYLRQIFKGQDEVIYQFNAGGRYPDFLINNNDTKIVLDTKYKRNWDVGHIDDIRQICAYSRMKTVIKKLVKGTEIIDCLVISLDNDVYKDEEQNQVKIKEWKMKVNELSSYSRLYNVCISLPVI